MKIWIQNNYASLNIKDITVREAIKKMADSVLEKYKF